MRWFRWLMVAPFVWTLCAGWGGSLFAADFEQVFRQAGLVQRSPMLVLADEPKVGDLLREAGLLSRKVPEAQRIAEQARQAVEGREHMLTQLNQQREQLRAQFELTRDPVVLNRLTTAMNEIEGRMAVLLQNREMEPAAKKAQAIANQAAEEYAEKLLQADRLATQLVARYRNLANDPAIKAAMEGLSRRDGVEYRLGPTSTLLANARRAQTLLKQAVEDAVPIRPAGEGRWSVSVMVNGAHAVEMIVDQGATLILLPAKLAREIGMAPSPDDPELSLHLSDGTVLAARRKTAKTVRVGRFAVSDVECCILPEALADVEPRLGMSYLGKFEYEIDPDRRRLVFSAAVEDAEEIASHGSVAAPAHAAESPAEFEGMGDPPIAEGPSSPEDRKTRIAELARALAPGDTAVLDRFAVLSTAGQRGQRLFRPSRNGPVQAIAARLGPPDARRKIASPKDEDIAGNIEWEMWTWGSLYLLVDPQGVVRFYAVVD